MNFKIILILTLTEIFSATAQATNLDLETYLGNSITNVMTETQALSTQSDTSVVMLQDINLSVSSTLSFGVNNVVGLSITPEIDFVFSP